MYSYAYAYMLLLCLLYIQNSYGYLAYFIEDRSGMSKHVIDDYIPEWNEKCFTQDIYKNVLCSVSTMTDSCIFYVQCVSSYCSANVIQLYQHYAKYHNLSGVVFHGTPAFEGECIMPSTFIQEDLSLYIKNNIIVEFRYDDTTTKTTIRISEVYKYGMIVFMTFFAIGLIFKYRNSHINPSNTWFWHRSPLPNFNSINVGDYHENTTEDDNNEHDVNESENSQIRILINRNYTPSDSEPPTCAICLDSFEDGDTISKLSCEHEFKYECINAWLKKKPSCPLCNSQE